MNEDDKKRVSNQITKVLDEALKTNESGKIGPREVVKVLRIFKDVDDDDKKEVYQMVRTSLIGSGYELGENAYA